MCVCVCVCFCDSLSVCVQIAWALKMSNMTLNITRPCRVYKSTLTKIFDAQFEYAYSCISAPTSSVQIHYYISYGHQNDS